MISKHLFMNAKDFLMTQAILEKAFLDRKILEAC